jgi:hypothetical protein
MPTGRRFLDEILRKSAASLVDTLRPFPYLLSMRLPVRGRFVPWLAVICALLISGNVGAGDETERPPTTWSEKQAGIRLDLPRTWSMQGLPGIPPLMLREGTGRAVMGVMVAPLPESDAPPDLQALTDKSLDAHRKSVDRFKLLNRHDAEVAGTPATEIYFRGKRAGEAYKWIQTMFVSRNHKVYVLYSAPTNLYLRYLGDYDQLVRSIRRLP